MEGNIVCAPANSFDSVFQFILHHIKGITHLKCKYKPIYLYREERQSESAIERCAYCCTTPQNNDVNVITFEYGMTMMTFHNEFGFHPFSVIIQCKGNSSFEHFLFSLNLWPFILSRNCHSNIFGENFEKIERGESICQRETICRNRYAHGYEALAVQPPVVSVLPPNVHNGSLSLSEK